MDNNSLPYGLERISFNLIEIEGNPRQNGPMKYALGGSGMDGMALRPLGRPKDMEKREAVLDAAIHLFSERGMEGVPVDAIAAAAGVSKVTIYANFKDKPAILEAIVLRETERLGREVAEISDSDSSLSDRLTQVGAGLVDMLTAPCHMALDRCLGVEAQRNPELARRFFEAGPGRLRSLLAEMLNGAVLAGEVQLDCTTTAAEDLLGLWLGFSAIERRFLCGAVDKDVLLARVHRSVKMFLRANTYQI
jgi:TetR/AcrR family transcriptional repressor of mexJK operon